MSIKLASVSDGEAFYFPISEMKIGDRLYVPSNSISFSVGRILSDSLYGRNKASNEYNYQVTKTDSGLFVKSTETTYHRQSSLNLGPELVQELSDGLFFVRNGLKYVNEYGSDIKSIKVSLMDKDISNNYSPYVLLCGNLYIWSWHNPLSCIGKLQMPVLDNSAQNIKMGSVGCAIITTAAFTYATRVSDNRNSPDQVPVWRTGEQYVNAFIE